MGREALQLGRYDGSLQVLILKFGHLTTLRTNHVMVRLVLVCPLVLRRAAEMMPDNQIGVHQQDEGIIKRSPTYAEVSLRLHVIVEHVYVKVPLDGINRIEYSISFGRFPVPVLLQIIGQHLFDYVSYVLFHTSSLFSLQS